MAGINRKHTRPLDIPRSRRTNNVRALTSLPAGKVVPLAAFPLLREDDCSGRLQVGIEMSETAEILMNGVYATLNAYLVPWLAFERFNGSMDVFNRSYAGLPPFDGEAVIPFFAKHTMGAHGSKPLYKYLGLHAKEAAEVNTMYAEAYNAIWNFRAVNRSKDITARTALDTSLAPAFWRHENFSHIVPNWDAATMDGEVALNVVNAILPVSGIALAANNAYTSTAAGAPNFVQADGVNPAPGANWSVNNPAFKVRGDNVTKVPDIYAEMAENGITVSLATIDQARKMQSFARLREQYTGFDDDYIVDMLMSGLSIPDQALKQPMLIGTATNVFGMNKRYSSDADALTASAVNGMTQMSMNVRVPRLSTGGVVMVTAEITPEQLFERQKDPFFHIGSVASLPEFMRDSLDEQPVSVVNNDYVDIDHDTPNGTFGYAPLNHEWMRNHYAIGGKFYRPAVDAAFDEDRQRIWAVETENPVLSEDFYLCTTIHQKPFLDVAADPFEAVTIMQTNIGTNTVFGGRLVEAMNNYEAVKAKAPTDHIEQGV